MRVVHVQGPRGQGMDRSRHRLKGPLHAAKAQDRSKCQATRLQRLAAREVSWVDKGFFHRAEKPHGGVLRVYIRSFWPTSSCRLGSLPFHQLRLVLLESSCTRQMQTLPVATY
jgi:hypothetical protein